MFDDEGYLAYVLNTFVLIIINTMRALYEIIEKKPVFVLDTDFLDFIGYPKREELEFIPLPNKEFRVAYEEFAARRFKEIETQFVALIKKQFC